MGRKRFKFSNHGMLLLVLIVLTNSQASTAKEIPGFLNIDCGREESAPYEDPRTNLTWNNDDRFTRSGMNRNVSFNHPDVENFQALSTFRYFPKHQNKHCYELPLTRPNTSFLIRAMFFHNVSGDSELMKKSKFDLAINASVWYTVEYDNADWTVIAEGIFFSAGLRVNFCLIEREGISFISSLELRELDREGKLYNFEGSQSAYLINIWRYSFDPNDDIAIIRYPEDPYDRFWNKTNRVHVGTDTFISNSSAINIETSADVNYIPAAVILSAVVFNSSDTITLVVLAPSPSYSSDGIASGENYYAYGIFYFQDLTDSEERGNFTVSINGHKSPPLSSGQNSTTKYEYPYFALPAPSSELYLKFENENKSERLSSLNAAETYQQKLFDFTITEDSDDKAIKFLREAYNLEDWEGDPCIPNPFLGLNCSTSFWSKVAIESLNLTSLGRPINLSISTEDAYAITFVDVLDWSLTDSNVDDEFFDIIINRMLQNSSDLDTLDLSYNNITAIPSAELWPLLSPFYMSFSNNNLQGEMMSFNVSGTSLFDYLTELNLSHNRITSLPRNPASVPWLAKLDISHNLISENVSSLDGILDPANAEFYTNFNSSLIELQASNNNFGGTFSSPLYFTKLNALEIVNFDTNNIQGVLDLTLWVDSWLRQAHNRSYKGGTFSFINNSISDIRPSHKELEPTLLNFSNHFQHFNESRRILLDGNPYCQGPGRADTFANKYLCRTPDSKKNNLLKVLLPTLLGGGVLITIIIASFSVMIWRLRKQVLSLQRIQDELAERKVQPPFFSFRDIRAATKNFHAKNMIGKGGFGVVYKGILGDGTTVAVKKLMNLEHIHVLDDFLNEVVLVTGIKHKNLIQLKGCCIKDQEKMLVYDYAEQGNLHQALHGREESEPLIMVTRINLCFGIAQGLYYLHSELQPRIIHRDIKPANILLDQNFNAKIADFGLARFASEDDHNAQITRKAGTWGYLAPEYELSDKMDVFSFGILVLEIMSGKKCFNHEIPTEDQYLRTWAHELDQSNKLLNLLPDYLRKDCDENAITSLLKVAVRCTAMNPKNRPSMFSVLTMLGGIFIQPKPYVEEDVDPKLPDWQTLFGLNNGNTATFTESCEGEEDEFPLLDPEHVVGTSQLPSTSSEIEMQRTSHSFSKRSSSFFSRD